MFTKIASVKPVVLAALLIPMCFASLPLGAVVTEDLKLVPDNPQPGSNFGAAVAIGQGVAVIGARNSGVGGAAYLFDTTTGQQLFKLEPDDLIADADFGRWMAADGNLTVIGARDQNFTGAAYVFDMTTGSQVAKLEIATGISSVAIYENTVLVGSPGLNSGLGGVLMFDVTSGNLIQTFIADTPEASDALGDSVAFEGGLVAVFNLNNQVFNQNSVLLFDPLTGNQLADIAAPDNHVNISAVAFSGDNLLVGAANIISRGQAGLFNIGDLNNITELILPWPGLTNAFLFGNSVALNDDVALVSTWFSEDIDASGIVHMFDSDTGNLLESFRSSDGIEDDIFGNSIGLHGQTLIVGAPGEPTTTGAAYLFTIPEPGTLALWVGGLALLRRRVTIRHVQLRQRPSQQLRRLGPP